jgi:hypothetical protein
MKLSEKIGDDTGARRANSWEIYGEVMGKTVREFAEWKVICYTIRLGTGASLGSELYLRIVSLCI